MFTVQRIGEIVNQLAVLRHPERIELKDWTMSKQKGETKPTPTDNNGCWNEIPENGVWGGNYEYYAFAGSAAIPAAFAGKNVDFIVSTGKEDQWAATNPQFSLYVNGKLRQGFDGNHYEYPLTDKAEEGDVYDFFLSAFSGSDNYYLQFKPEIAVLDTVTEKLYYWHQAHSYVRGNWRNSAESSPMIMSKSCHDMDILIWLMDEECTQVSSYGSLSHFRKENAPEGAPERCLDGCPHRNECPYYAPRIYIQWKDAWQADVLRKVVSLDTSPAGLTNALKTGPYGRCVYHCDNDVVDHQVVNIEFASGATASFTMNAFTFDQGRFIKVMGTKGIIEGSADDIVAPPRMAMYMECSNRSNSASLMTRTPLNVRKKMPSWNGSTGGKRLC